MTRRHWITAKECNELYSVNGGQLIDLVRHKVVVVKRMKAVSGRLCNHYNHKQVIIYGKMNRGQRRNYMAKLNGTKLGRPFRTKKPKKVMNVSDFKKEQITSVKAKYGHAYLKAKKHISYPFVTGVDNPEHYNTGEISIIDAIDDWKLDFSAGNVVKYVVRAGKKNKSERKKDLQKALWYIIRMLKDE
jgi:hypothetical protein